MIDMDALGVALFTGFFLFFWCWGAMKIADLRRENADLRAKLELAEELYRVSQLELSAALMREKSDFAGWDAACAELQRVKGSGTYPYPPV